MYLVRLPQDHPAQWLFVHADPRPQGCPYPVEEHVHYEDQAIDADLGSVVLMQSKTDPTRFVRCVRDCEDFKAEHVPLDGVPLLLSLWSVYANHLRRPFSVMLHGGWNGDAGRNQVPRNSGSIGG